MNVREVIASATFALAAAFATAGCSQCAETPAWKTLSKPAALPMPDESGLAPVDDIKMWYAIFNRGGPNPVLLIHGGLVNADTWGNQVPALAKTHEVIIADSRGHGRCAGSTVGPQPAASAAVPARVGSHGEDRMAPTEYRTSCRKDSVNMVSPRGRP